MLWPNVPPNAPTVLRADHEADALAALAFPREHHIHEVLTVDGYRVGHCPHAAVSACATAIGHSLGMSVPLHGVVTIVADWRGLCPDQTQRILELFERFERDVNVLTALVNDAIEPAFNTDDDTAVMFGALNLFDTVLGIAMRVSHRSEVEQAAALTLAHAIDTATGVGAFAPRVLDAVESWRVNTDHPNRTAVDLCAMSYDMVHHLEGRHGE